MKIVVCIKQVPEIGEARINPVTGTLDRSEVPLTINPIDLHALELALQLKEQNGGEILVISMGPGSAEKILREALALGCDDARLITGKEFAASDTYATSSVLAGAIGILPAVDLVIAGEKAIDGDTGQIGPEVAAFLDLPIFSYVIDFYLTPNGHFHIERLTERGSQSVEIDPPCVVTVTKGINVPRFPTLHGKRKARQKIIQILDASSLPIHRERIGLEGSPTRVVKVENVQVERKGIILRDMDEVEMAERFIQFLEEKGVLKNGSSRE